MKHGMLGPALHGMHHGAGQSRYQCAAGNAAEDVVMRKGSASDRPAHEVRPEIAHHGFDFR
jgi:hypothetical protein